MKFSKKTNEEIDFWKGVLIRGFAIFGYTFFALLITQDFRICIVSSLVSGGLYVFTEALRHYKLSTPTINKKGKFNYFIHP